MVTIILSFQGTSWRLRVAVPSCSGQAWVGMHPTVFLLPKAVKVLNQRQVHTLAQTVYKLSSFLDLEYVIFQMTQTFRFPYHDMTAFASVLPSFWGNLNSNLQVQKHLNQHSTCEALEWHCTCDCYLYMNYSQQTKPFSNRLYTGIALHHLLLSYFFSHCTNCLSFEEESTSLQFSFQLH